MFTKEQLAQIIKEETAAVLAEQEVNEGPFGALKGGISKVGGDIKKYAGDVVKAGKTASLRADIKKQLDIVLKQKAANDAAYKKLQDRASKLGIDIKTLAAEPPVSAEVPPSGPEAGEPTSPKE